MLYEENVQVIRFSKDDGLSNGLSAKNPTVEVKFENVTAKWKQDHQEDTLQNVTVTVPPKKLLAVIGPVGSGKVRCRFKLVLCYVNVKSNLDHFFRSLHFCMPF